MLVRFSNRLRQKGKQKHKNMKNQFLQSAAKIVLTALVTLSVSASSFANSPQQDKMGKKKMDKLEKSKMTKDKMSRSKM